MENFQILLSSLFTGLTTIFICPSLYANCTNASVNANFNVAIPKVTVSPEMPLGTVLAVSRPLTPGNAPVECKNVTSVVFAPYFTGTSAKKSTYGENVYNTGLC